MKVRTLILGGGMSGLSCAYHLKNNYALLERSDEPGGLSRSIRQDGFVFDHTGHLLHLRNPYTLKLIPELLGDNLVLNQRRAWIYSHHAYTRYPYQANLYGLPKKVIQECLIGLMEALMRKDRRSDAVNTETGLQDPIAYGGPERRKPESLRDWVLRVFGAGFGRHFFFPYNEKLWTVSPDVLTAEWAAPFVPKPSIQEVINGAFSDQTKKYGYNATFYYPKEGGIQALAFAFAKNLPDIHLNTEVTGIDLERKEVTTARGDTFAYDHLVNTLPLVRFLQMAKPLPPPVQEALKTLRWSSVYNINLGVDRANISDKHWIYFPEKKYPFYRVGFPMNFSVKMTPPGCSSMYVEIAYEPGHSPNDKTAMAACLKGLRDCGLLKKNDRIVTEKILHIPVAYVTFDKNRTVSTNRLLSYLQSINIHSIGRFGAWKYSYMEEAILEGKTTAEKILGI